MQAFNEATTSILSFFVVLMVDLRLRKKSAHFFFRCKILPYYLKSLGESHHTCSLIKKVTRPLYFCSYSTMHFFFFLKLKHTRKQVNLHTLLSVSAKVHGFLVHTCTITAIIGTDNLPRSSFIWNSTLLRYFTPSHQPNNEFLKNGDKHHILEVESVQVSMKCFAEA